MRPGKFSVEFLQDECYQLLCNSTNAFVSLILQRIIMFDKNYSKKSFAVSIEAVSLQSAFKKTG